MIRDYRSDDTDILVEIWRSASTLAHPFLGHDFIEREAQNLRNTYLPHAQTSVVEVEGLPVGFVAMIENEIGGLFLDPSHHGFGLGKAMVDHVASSRDALKVEVFEKNVVGRKFYDRYGFQETGRYLHEPSGQLTLQMAMSIK